MELIQLAALPFRLITQNGIQAYASDLGDVRLIVYDVNLLTGGPIVQQDLFTLQNINYTWSLRLPAKLDIVPVPGVNSLYQIIPATNTVMMCCRLYSGSQGSIGEITGILKDSQVSTEKVLYYNFTQQIVTVGGFPNKLVGAVVIDKFNNGIPASYSDKVKSTMMFGNTSSTSTDLLTYGTPQNSANTSPYDSWVASSELEMLSLTVKEGDRCWRPDLNISLINTTGFNSTIADWRPLGGAIDSVNTETVNVLISESMVPIINHIDNHNNPHNTTATQVGLGLVPNHDFTSEVNANTAKVGITAQQAANINTANAHITTIAGNPHRVTKAEVGLSSVPNIDFTTSVNLSIVHDAIVTGNPHRVTKTEVGLGDVPNIDFTQDIVNANVHKNTITGNPHQVTKTEVGLGDVPNHDFTAEVNAATVHIAVIAGNPHHVTKDEVGLSLVPNHDFTNEVTTNSIHRNTTSGNPHQVTKAEVGLGNVPNVDCTNASNITTGVLPSSVIPPVVIVDTYPVSSQAAQLALTVHKGVIAVRTDISRTYINTTGNNASMSDWQEMMTPNDAILSVNGQIGTVVLSTTNISEGINLYYTDERVSANSDVVANTANRHVHNNKSVLDATTDSFTTQIHNAIDANTAKVGITQVQANAIVANTAKIGITQSQADAIVSSTTHRNVTSGNPHQVTKTEVGLSDVPNHDFTDEVNANSSARHIHTNKSILDTTTASFTTAQVNAIIANTAKVGITQAQADAIVANTAKVGITTQQASDITAANTHRATITGNVHNVTKTDVGLGDVPNVDFTTDVNANTAARHGHINKSVLDAIDTPFTTSQANAIVANTAKVGITTAQADAIVVNTAKVGITTNQAADIVSANTHRAAVNGNVHNVTKAEVGLGNVPNVDCTNAANITTGVLPSSVLPPLAIVDVFPVASQIAQLALTIQKGDIAIRTDISRSYINTTGNNTMMSDWQELMTPVDSVLSVNSKTGTVILTTSDIGEGTNLYYTEARVSANTNVSANTAARHSHANKAVLDATTASFTTAQANAIIANTAKVGITTAQANAIIANTAKVGITTQQAADIVSANTHRAAITGNVHQVTKSDVGLGLVPNTDFTATVAANTAARHSHANKTVLDATDTAFTAAQANAITINTAKVGITTAQADAIVANTAKVGITTQNLSDITAANTHRATVTGNVHNVTKDDVGLGNVPNYDFTAEVAASTAVQHNHTNKTILDNTDATFTTVQANAIVANTAKVGITQVQADAIVANTAKVGITTQQVSDIISANTHRATITGNVHNVTKAEIGLGNVPNVDCTNASNITTGTLPSSVLPPLAITDTYVVATQVAQLALTVQKGDIVVRTDISRTYINTTGNNDAMSDWQEMMTPIDTVLTVNGHVGTIVLTTSDIGEGSNLYYTEARVSANTNVSANTAARHSHANKVILDATDASFTTSQANAIVANTAKVGITQTQADAIVANTAKVGITSQNLNDITAANIHIATKSGNPHQVTKAEVGLGNVPNHDFTAEVAASTAVQHSHANKAILDATTVSFTTTISAAIDLNTAKVGITSTQASAIVANTAKVGITTQQATDITAANTHRAAVTGNVHNVTKAEVGLGNVPNTDFTAAVAASTAVQHSHVNKVVLDATDTAFTATQASAIVANTAKIGITQVQADAIVANTAKVGITTQNLSDITAANTHRAIITGNPHQVTKSDVGLSNVKNIDCTNAANITTGILPSSVLPPLAVIDTFVVSTQVAQLALTAQKGDIAVRTDLNRTFINITGNNTAMSDWQELATPTDAVSSVNGKTGTVVLTTNDIAEGANIYYTDARVSTNSNVAANTAARHSHTNKAILDLTTDSFTTSIHSAVDLNTAKVGITTAQANAIVANTAKVGITTGQAADIVSANTHRAAVTGNVHNVTKADVGLGNVPNTDFTAAVAASTAVQHSHANKTVLDATTDSFTTQIHSAIDLNTTKVGITQAQADAIVANTAKVGITTQQASDITSANTHRAAVTGNVHNVTKADVGLSNVKNIDCTNAANITTGILPSSVLPPLAIVDVFPVASQAAQLALTVQKGDIAVRTDLSKTYINITGNNTTMSDWQELMTPIDSVLSVNSKTGTIVLSTSDIAEGSNLYYTDARVSANSNVAANTAARHNHANKAILDTTDTAFTAVQANAIIANTAKIGITQAQADAIVANTAKVGITAQNLADIVSANTHIATITGNVHQVTKAEVGLGNVPNTDFTAAVAASTAVQHSHANKTILDLTTASFTTAQASAIVANTAKVGITQAQADAIVANTAKVGITTQQASDITSANAHRAIIAGNPHQVTKTDVGLSNVKNIDCTNAANITTGILPSSVLPPLAIVDVFPVASQAAQLALTVQKGDIAVRTDLSRTYINTTGNNLAMSDWQELATPIDAVSTVNGKVGTVILTTSDIGEGTNLYYTEARVSANSNVSANTAARHSHVNKVVLEATDTAFTSTQASAIIANTAKVGITQAQADAIVANTAKVGITTQNLSDITAANTHRAAITGNVHNVTKADIGLSNVPNTDFTAAVAASTAVQHSHTNKAILDATTASFTTAQASAIVANTAKVGITQAQADAIVANTAKVGITAQQASDITAANTHRAAVIGNVHNVTKAEIGLSNVPNTDFTSDVTLNTANRHSHANKTILDATTDSFTTSIHSAIDLNTAKVGITTAQANAIIANTAKVGITAQQSTDITSANTHRAAVTGNVHNVTKADVGLGLVPNVDCTNASNITTGTLPSSVLPPLAIVDTYVVTTQSAQLALTVQKGDVAVRTDLSKSYINQSGNNTTMSDWQELMTPINAILSVNGQTGTVVLSTTNITEGTNLYYTDARVTANANVSANTAARHSHANKAALDLVTGNNTGDQTTITGNAGSANKLATARTINNVAFDGTANITIPVGTGDVTMVGVQTLTNKTMEAVVLSKSVTEGISVMADNIITAVNGTILTKALAANTIFTDSLLTGQSVVLTITNASTYTVTWPTVIWVSADGNIAPLLSANNVFVFWKIGTTLYGTLTGSF